MKPSYRRLYIAVSLILFIGGLLLVSRLAEPVLFKLLSYILQRTPTYTAGSKLQKIGVYVSSLGIVIFLVTWLSNRLARPFSIFIQRIESKLTWGEDYRSDGMATESFIPQQRTAPGSTNPPPWWSRIKAFDGFVVIIFLLFAILFFLGRIQGNYPTVELGGDAANIASFAAGWDHPSLFQGDALLGDLNNIRIYATIHIPMLRWLNGFMGDYGLAMTSTLPLHIFVFALGFYVLGWVIFKSRYWAFLFAILNLLPYEINLQEDWGVFTDPVPRFTFQALLPFLLTFIWMWRDQPRRWPWLMAFSGALVYIHPVSTPAWMFAIWLALWFFLPKDWSLIRKLATMVGLGLISAAVAMPFIWNYLNSHVQGQSANYDLVVSIIDSFFPKNLINIPAAMADFLKKVQFLLPLSLVGLAATWFLRRGARKDFRLILGWCLGLLLMAVLIPWIEHVIERYLRLVPLETELVRAIRYFIPFMYLFLLWPLVELSRRLKNPAVRRFVPAAGALIVALFVILIPPYPQLFSRDLACFSTGKLICAGETDQDRAMVAIRTQVPQGATIFTSAALNSLGSYGIVIRYQGLHPVVFSYKDRGLLVYSNDKALTTWINIYEKMAPTKDTEGVRQKLKLIVAVASQLNAQYLLLDFQPRQKDIVRYGLTPVYSNPGYMLFKMKTEG